MSTASVHRLRRVGEVALEAQLGSAHRRCTLRARDLLSPRRSRCAGAGARRRCARPRRRCAAAPPGCRASCRPGVVGAALLHRLDGELERGLRVADRRAADAVRAERGQRHAVHRVRVALARPETRRRRARRTCTAPGARARTRPSPPPSCCRWQRMPSTCQSSTISYSDLGSRHMRWSTTLSPSRTVHREHVPVGDVDAAGEIPAPADDEAARRPCLRAALREGDARGDQRLRVRAPDFLLRALVVQREHPVVDQQVADVPAGGGAAARELGGEIRRRRRSRTPCRPSAWAAATRRRPVRCRSASVSGSMMPLLLGARGALAQRRHERRARARAPPRSRRRRSRAPPYPGAFIAPVLGRRGVHRAVIFE